MHLSSKQRTKLFFIDFCICTMAYVVPLIVFPEKSRFHTQLVIGLICALITLLFSNFNKLARYRDTLPVIAELYGPFIGLMASFANISFLAFIYQEYLFSRYINITGIIICGLYFLMSRVLIFKQLAISNIDLKLKSGELNKGTLNKSVFYEDSRNRCYQSFDFESQIRLDNHYYLLGIKDDPWSVFEPKVVFYDNRPFLCLLNGGSLQDSRTGFLVLKRSFDILFSIVMLLVLFVPGLLVYFMSLIIQRENPIFKQKRLGLHGKVFEIIKFKTFFGEDNQVSFWGKILRRSNLDEIPQLINILKGDMSVVGPRAEIVSKATPKFVASRRNAVKPGLTGFWQLGPYRDKSIESHMEYDIYYLMVRSLIVDLIVVLLTPFFALTNNARK